MSSVVGAWSPVIPSFFMRTFCAAMSAGVRPRFFMPVWCSFSASPPVVLTGGLAVVVASRREMAGTA